MWGSEMVAYVKNYEAMYRALVRRLVDIADSANTMGADSHVRILDYDLVARAHEHTVDVWKEMVEDGWVDSDDDYFLADPSGGGEWIKGE